MSSQETWLATINCIGRRAQCAVRPHPDPEAGAEQALEQTGARRPSREPNSGRGARRTESQEKAGEREDEAERAGRSVAAEGAGGCVRSRDGAHGSVLRMTTAVAANRPSCR